MSTPDALPDLGTVLTVFAHPDDETYLAGGLMSALVDRGNRVVAVSATAGERGTAQPERWPPDRLRATREWELAGSLAVLGVREHRILGFGDGELDRVSIGHGGAIVAELFEEFRPDTVVTFGADGITGHSDHRAVAAWVEHAVSRCALPPRRLVAALEERYCAEFATLHHELSVFMDPAAPVTLPLEDLELHLELSGAWHGSIARSQRFVARRPRPRRSRRQWVRASSGDGSPSSRSPTLFGDWCAGGSPTLTGTRRRADAGGQPTTRRMS